MGLDRSTTQKAAFPKRVRGTLNPQSMKSNFYRIYQLKRDLYPKNNYMIISLYVLDHKENVEIVEIVESSSVK